MKWIKKLWVSEATESLISDYWNERIFISSISGKISIKGGNNKEKVTKKGETFATTDSPLYLEFADGENERIKIVSKSGAVFIRELKAKEINIDTNSGIVILQNCITNNLKLKSKCGNIELTNVVTENGNISLATGTLVLNGMLLQDGKFDIRDSGNIYFDNLAVSESLNLTVACGNISGKNLATNTGSITNHCGNIELENVNLGSTEVYSDNGNIEIATKNDFNSDNIYCNNGKVKIKSFC